MKITAARLRAYRLPLRAEWVSAASGFSVREGWLLRLETSDGRCGYGDCAPLANAGSESPEVAEAALRTHAQQLVGMSVSDALAVLPDAYRCNAPAARCSVETAVLDLLAQAENLPLSRYLRGDCAANTVAVNAALGYLLRVDQQDIVSACAAGFSLIKLKVGIASLADEMACLQRIAELLPAKSELRLDANGAWCEVDAAHFIEGCAGLPIEMLEEPLSDPLPDALRRLQANCTFPLALDESLSKFDWPALFAAPPVRRLVLKPPSIGGLLPALALARRASAAGLQCIVTSSIDSACGVLAAAHLAAALDNGLAHGLATSSWLTADTGSAPAVADGQLILPERTGLGFLPLHASDFS